MTTPNRPPLSPLAQAVVDAHYGAPAVSDATGPLLSSAAHWSNSMTDTLNRPPLWKVMRAADTSCASDFTSPEARAICALRDWLVPEEPPPHRGMRPGGTNLTYQETLSVERQRLRALLTAEAGRAERGDG